MSQQLITVAQLRSWLLLYADRIEENVDYLTELDAAIGDADHGVNMRSGMTKLRNRLAANDSPGDSATDISSFLRTVAMILISSIGGAAGPLYGSFFLNASKCTDATTTLDCTGLAHLFRSGLDGVIQRGKARLGDKTMIDALEPAVEALETAAMEGADIQDALTAARHAAQLGMDSTTDLEALRGRASYLGPRSIGHQDPGATSAYILIETAADRLGQTLPEQDA